MSTSELDSRNIAISMRKSVENLVISSQDAIGQSISQALNFSGVIANQTNQIIQDSKNLSRSPSPSLRNHEAPVDLIDNDKTSETSIQVPPYPALDTISVSSASDIAAALPAAAKSEANAESRAQPAGARGGSADGARAKKKSWYNSLYPTYKSKSDDFKRLFKDLPDDERLIVDYSCALQKDILAHGRLYASQNYLCFYASIFGWETSLSLRWKDVTAITKEKTALVIPNAILVCTEGEKNFLTSFSGRDKAYLMLFRIWQNALMDSPMTSQEIWQWVHSCYGEELGFNSDDEGYACSRDLHTDTASTEELVDSMEAAGAGDEPTRQRDSSPPLMTNGDGESVSGAGGGAGAADSAGVGAEGDTLPTDMSDSSDSEPDKPHHDGEGEKCNCPHNGRLFLNRQFPFNIDQLFTMLFTNSKFNLELLASRGATDYVQSPWQVSAGRKVRQASYRLALTSGPIGPKEVHITETQVMNKCSKSGYLYSIDASSENAGIPYADYFTVDAHYCLQRVSENVTEFSFYGHIKYKKTMWPMVKAFLEKNTLSGIEEYARQIESKVVAEGEGAAPAARKGRRRHRPIASSADSSVSRESRASISLSLAPRVAAGRPARSAPWLAGILALLLLINGLLYWRLYYGERRIDMDDLQTRMSAAHGAALAQWGALLERHTRRQRGELLAWRAALDGTIAHLAQTEQALRQLLETIKPSLEEAETPPPEADSGGTPDTGGKSRDKVRDEM